MSTTGPDVEPKPTAAPGRREATVRALVVGCGIGLVLAAGNVYTGLKTGFIDGGGITAALLGFLIFSGFRRLGAGPYSVLENNITQTTASSAAIMGFVVGLAGPVPALHLLGTHLPGWSVAVWGTGAGLLGIAAAGFLRRKLVVDDALPFPTGAATAEVIGTIHTARAVAVRRAWLLLGAAAAAMAVTWFRDGRPAFIPQATLFGGAIGGIAAASVTLGITWSPLIVSTGAMIGTRAAGSMLLGGGIAWAVLAPWLLRSGIVREASYGALSSWMVWPGLGLLVAGSFVPLALQGGSVLRSFRDLGALGRHGSDLRARALGLLLLAGVAVLVIVGATTFGVGPAAAIGAVLLALLLTNVSARATGETDVGPVGAVGLLTQLAFAGGGTLTSVLAGWISTGSSSQSSQTLWAFRAGDRLGASPRAQVGAQLLGALLGGAIVVPVYLLVAGSYGVGTEAMPAASAQSWKAMAEAVSGGVAALPRYGPLAGAAGLVAGTVLVLRARTSGGRFLPSPAAMGMAMLIPGSYSIAAFAGALLVIGARRLRPGLDHAAVLTLAAGGIAGESITGVVIAALNAAGVL